MRGKRFANWQVLTPCELALLATLTSLPKSCRLLTEPSLTAAVSCAPQAPSVFAALTTIRSIGEGVC